MSGFKNDRVALPFRFETRVRRRLHELGGNQNLTRVIDLDNHRKPLPSIIIRLNAPIITYRLEKRFESGISDEDAFVPIPPFCQSALRALAGGNPVRTGH